MILIADVWFPDPEDVGIYRADGGPDRDGYTWIRSNGDRRALVIPKDGFWCLIELGSVVICRSGRLHTVDAKRILTWLETGDRTSLGEAS